MEPDILELDRAFPGNDLVRAGPRVDLAIGARLDLPCDRLDDRCERAPVDARGGGGRVAVAGAAPLGGEAFQEIVAEPPAALLERLLAPALGVLLAASAVAWAIRRRRRGR